VIVLLFAAALAYAISFLPNEESRRLTSFFILGIVALTVLLSFFEEYARKKNWRRSIDYWSLRRSSSVTARRNKSTRARSCPATCWC